MILGYGVYRGVGPGGGEQYAEDEHHVLQVVQARNDAQQKLSEHRHVVQVDQQVDGAEQQIVQDDRAVAQVEQPEHVAQVGVQQPQRLHERGRLGRGPPPRGHAAAVPEVGAQQRPPGDFQRAEPAAQVRHVEARGHGDREVHHARRHEHELDHVAEHVGLDGEQVERALVQHDVIRRVRAGDGRPKRGAELPADDRNRQRGQFPVEPDDAVRQPETPASSSERVPTRDGEKSKTSEWVTASGGSLSLGRCTVYGKHGNMRLDPNSGRGANHIHLCVMSKKNFYPSPPK